MKRHFSANSFNVITTKDPMDISKIIAHEPDLVVIWNVAQQGTRQNVLDLKKAGLKVAVAEVAFFPQKAYVVIDPLGINAESSIVRGWLPKEIKPEWREDLEKLRRPIETALSG